MSETARLQAKLTMDDSQAQATLRRFGNSASRTAQEASAGFAKLNTVAASFGVGLGASAVVGFGKAILDAAGSIVDMSEALGISAESLQRFSYVFEQSGGKQEDFVKGMRSLIEVAEKAKDGNEQALGTFQKLGISFADIQSLSPEDVLLRIADALKAGGMSTEEFAAVSDVLGSKVALKLVPSLKMGSDGFLEMGKSARIMQQETLDSLDEIGDAFSRLKRDAIGGAGNALVGFGKAFAGGFGSAIDANSGTLSGMFGADVLSGLAMGAIEGFNGAFSGAPDSPEALRKRANARRGAAASAAGPMIAPAQAAQIAKLEADAAAAKAESEKLGAEYLTKQMNAAAEITRLYEQAEEIEAETRRAKLSTAEQIAELESKRLAMLAQAKTYEEDILGLHLKEAAALRVGAARIGGQVENLRADMVDTSGLPFKGVTSRGPEMRDVSPFDAFQSGRGGTLLVANGGIQGAKGGLVGGLAYEAEQRAKKEAEAAAKREKEDASLRDVVGAINSPAWTKGGS